MSARRTTAAEVLTELMLAVFRVNALLLDKGDELVAPLQLTSARWQVLGAIALAAQPLSAPQIAAAMGISRQGVQKQLNRALEEGLIELFGNPRHERSPLHELTETGRRAYEAAMALESAWAKALVQGLALADLQAALQLLNRFEARLAATPVPVFEALP